MAAVVAAIFVFIAMLAMASPALADSFVVTTTDDTPVADAAVCDSNCSLREAVKLANSNAVADTITFDKRSRKGRSTTPLPFLLCLYAPKFVEGKFSEIRIQDSA